MSQPATGSHQTPQIRTTERNPSDAGQAKVAQHLAPLLQAYLPSAATPRAIDDAHIFSNQPAISPPTSTPPVDSNTWTNCANEGGTCTFSGTRFARYGANGQYVYQTAATSIGCTNSVFGDPIQGTFKSCYSK